MDTLTPHSAKSRERGIITLEIMIALSVMVITLSAIVIVAFGNQSFLIGGQTASEAMNKAQELVEEAQALARKDFNLVNQVATTTDDIFKKAVYVKLLPDLLTKEVRAVITWKDERQTDRYLDLTTLVANFDTPTGGDTCNSALSDSWTGAHIVNAVTDFATLVSDAGATYTISDIDAYKGRLYVTASNTSGATKSTFFIFNVSNPATPTLLGKIDNEGAGGLVQAGLNAVRVSEDPASSPLKTYAYVATAHSPNYSTCTPGVRCAQMQIIEVTDPGNPQVQANLMIASSTAPFVKGNQTHGSSLYYRNGYLLLGLTATGAGNGPEFHILDVHNPTSLFGSNTLFPVGSYPVGNDINAVGMRGTYAYVATPNTQELQILNITNPSTPSLVGGFNSPSGAGNGKSMYLVGDKLYLGVTVPNTGNDLHVLDNTNPAGPLPELSGVDTASSVNAVIVRSTLAFLATNTELRIVNATSSAVVATVALPVTSSSPIPEPSMDCEGNYVFVTSNDSSGRGTLSVITAP